jgi:hypothetical protein
MSNSDFYDHMEKTFNLRIDRKDGAIQELGATWGCSQIATKELDAEFKKCCDDFLDDEIDGTMVAIDDEYGADSAQGVDSAKDDDVDMGDAGNMDMGDAENIVSIPPKGDPSGVQDEEEEEADCMITEVKCNCAECRGQVQVPSDDSDDDENIPIPPPKNGAQPRFAREVCDKGKGKGKNKGKPHKQKILKKILSSKGGSGKASLAFVLQRICSGEARRIRTSRIIFDQPLPATPI